MKHSAILFACTALLTAAPARAQEMMTYQMVFLLAGPNPNVPSASAKAFQDAHLANLAKYNAQRINVLYGPFLDNGELRGIAILDVPNADEARKVFAEDPYVKAGHMIVEVHPWYGPKGWFHPPDDPPTTEPLIFGFLVRGPAPALPTAQAEEVQKGHLAYMAELNKQGKLVAAGPFGDDTPRRGIVIYRVKTVDEAKQLAAGDPAVKAGRLVLDARPWMTFKGILK